MTQINLAEEARRIADKLHKCNRNKVHSSNSLAMLLGILDAVAEGRALERPSIVLDLALRCADEGIDITNAARDIGVNFGTLEPTRKIGPRVI